MTAWIGIVLTILGGIISLAVMWGKFSTRMDNAETKLKEVGDKHDKYHGEHFGHSQDHQAHWTERERDMLEKKLDSMDKKLDKLLQNGSRLESN